MFFQLCQLGKSSGSTDLPPLRYLDNGSFISVQMQFIDSLDGEDLLLTGEVKWRPLAEENAQSILKVVKPTYNDTGL